jgi:lipopolysaccharide biosynthesis glycosyltransferase
MKKQKTDKQKLAYMLAVTADYVFCAGNIVLNLIRYRPKKDFRVIIYYEDMTRKEQSIFENTGICDLIKYVPPEGFAEDIISLCPKFKDETFAKHFSFLKFAKFEIFNHLKDFENVVWLDADIAIQDDTFSITEHQPFAISIDDEWTVQNNFTAPIENYDMERQGVCTAVFLVTDKIKEHGIMRQWCYDMSLKCAPYFKNIDQGIWNLLLQEFNIDYRLLDFKEWQCIPDRLQANIARIVHFGGHNRFKIWNNTVMLSCFPEWWRTHLKWLELGGQDFKKPDNFIDAGAYSKILDRDKKIVRLNAQVAGMPQSKFGYKVYIFKIPVLYKKIYNNKAKYLLFGFLPIWKIKYK